MLLTKDEAISEVKTVQANNNHILYEASDCIFHAAKLIAIEPYFIEIRENNDVGFTKTSMKGFFRLKFQEGQDIKTYEADANPEVVNKVYYYVTKNGHITNLFPDKKDIKAYVSQSLAKKSKTEEELLCFWFMMAPLMMIPLCLILEVSQVSLFYKIAMLLVWIASFISFVSTSTSEQEEDKKCREQGIKLQSFIEQVDNFEEQRHE